MGYRLTPRAADDLDAIADYTIETWGVRKLAVYLRSLVARFEWLAENPYAGRERSDVHPGYRSYPEGRHVIFYTVVNDGIVIIGVPHQSMDISPDWT